MDKNYMKQKAQLLYRTIQILCINEDKKIEEIQQQSNRCSDCESDEIIYPKGYTGSNIHSSGDSDNFFLGTSLIRWTGYCNKCGNEMPFATEYELLRQQNHYGKSHFDVKKVDFFMNGYGGYGH